MGADDPVSQLLSRLSAYEELVVAAEALAATFAAIDRGAPKDWVIINLAVHGVRTALSKVQADA